MQVKITARHTHLTDALRNHVEERVQKLARLLDSAISANVVLSIEKYRQGAEITLHGNGFKFHGEDVTNDLYIAVDNTVDKLRRQIEKHKTRRGSNRIRENQRESEATKSQPAMMEKTFKEEPDEPHPSGKAPPVAKTAHVPIKPMSIEEATLQLSAQNHQFFVFRNSKTEEINIVHRLRDGQIGLIAPEPS